MKRKNCIAGTIVKVKPSLDRYGNAKGYINKKLKVLFDDGDDYLPIRLGEIDGECQVCCVDPSEIKKVK